MMVNFGAEMAKPRSSAHSSIFYERAERAHSKAMWERWGLRERGGGISKRVEEKEVGVCEGFCDEGTPCLR